MRNPVIYMYSHSGYVSRHTVILEGVMNYYKLCYWV